MKDRAYQVFVDIWRLACKYRFRELRNEEWERLTDDGTRLFRRYENTSAEYLSRCLFMAVLDFYEKISADRKSGLEEKK